MHVIFCLCNDPHSKVRDEEVFSGFDRDGVKWIFPPRGEPTALQEELLFQVSHAHDQFILGAEKEQWLFGVVPDPRKKFGGLRGLLIEGNGQHHNSAFAHIGHMPGEFFWQNEKHWNLVKEHLTQALGPHRFSMLLFSDMVENPTFVPFHFHQNSAHSLRQHVPAIKEGTHVTIGPRVGHFLLPTDDKVWHLISPQSLSVFEDDERLLLAHRCTKFLFNHVSETLLDQCKSLDVQMMQGCGHPFLRIGPLSPALEDDDLWDSTQESLESRCPSGVLRVFLKVSPEKNDECHKWGSFVRKDCSRASARHNALQKEKRAKEVQDLEEESVQRSIKLGQQLRDMRMAEASSFQLARSKDSKDMHPAKKWAAERKQHKLQDSKDKESKRKIQATAHFKKRVKN